VIRKNLALMTVHAGLFACVVSSAEAQGPMTNTLPEAPLPVVVARFGPIELAPNLAVRQAGVDENVFNEAQIDGPKSDYVVGVAPELTMFARSGLIQFAASSAVEYTHYFKYESERSTALMARGRVELDLGPFRPSLAGAAMSTQERANNELDARARRRETELSTRLIYELSPLAQLFTSAARVDLNYRDGEEFRGVALADSLNRQLHQYQAGIRMNPTPFTTVIVDATFSTDRFVSSPGRDTDSRTIGTELVFGNDAVLRGRVRLGFQNFKPEDPTLMPFRGIVSSVVLNYRGFWRGRFDGSIERQVQYSYDAMEGYFLNTGGQITYTQHVFGPMDVQGVFGSWLMDYGKRFGILPHADETRMFGGGVGYNRGNGSRVGFNYEFRSRDAHDVRESYSRHRLYASYSYIY
jgi:putative beta-barrel porin BBP2